MTIDLIVENGLLVFPEGVVKGDLAIEAGRILAIGSSTAFPRAERKVDASGKFVLPGAIDTHTHFELPFMGETPPETWEQGTIAASFGGTTTVLDFVIQDKGGKLMDAVRAKVERAGKLARVDFSLHGCFTDFSDIRSVVAEVKEAVEYGISSFKEFMIYKKQGWQIDDWNLHIVLREAQKYGAIVGVHAENASIGESMIDKCLEEGKVEPVYHALSKPNFVEEEAIQRAVGIAKFACARLYIVHMSTKEGVPLVRAARAAGLPVYSETCTHYLTLTDDVYRKPDGINFILSPPLRKKEDAEALWHGLDEGSVSMVGSDHVAYTSDQKKKHSKTFAEVPNGAPGVELRLPIVYSEGVQKRRLSLPRLVEVCSTNAAKMFGIYPRKGTLMPGSDADVVVLDPKLEKTIRAGDLHMGSDYTMFEGMKVKGYPVVTILKGQIIVEGDQYLGRAADGLFLKSKMEDEAIASV